MLSLRANPKLPGDWKERHNLAIDVCGRYSWQLEAFPPFERAIIPMLQMWAQYADDHRAAYESPIGDDGVLGPHWQAVGLGIRGLLNGDCGPRLDCGTLDGFILDTLTANAVATETL